MADPMHPEDEKPEKRPCEVCAAGQPHERCNGHRKTDGQPCGRSPRKGGKVCRQCGGNTPQARAAEERAVQRMVLDAAMVTFGLPADGNPDELLLAEVRAIAGQLEWIRGNIRMLERDEVVWGQTQVSHQEGQSVEGPVDVTTTVEGASLNVWVDLEMKKSAALVKACDVAIRAGIRERLVRLAEQSGERAGQYWRAVLDTLSVPLTPEQREQALDAGVRHLYLLEAG